MRRDSPNHGYQPYEGLASLRNAHYAPTIRAPDHSRDIEPGRLGMAPPIEKQPARTTYSPSRLRTHSTPRGAMVMAG